MSRYEQICPHCKERHLTYSRHGPLWCGECRDLVRERGAIVTSEELIARSKEVKEQAVGRR